jgi:hypothetical protein
MRFKESEESSGEFRPGKRGTHCNCRQSSFELHQGETRWRRRLEGKEHEGWQVHDKACDGL